MQNDVLKNTQGKDPMLLFALTDACVVHCGIVFHLMSSVWYFLYFVY